MFEKEIKNVAKAIKSTGFKTSFDIPHYIYFDKTTGKPKQSPKNLKAMEIVNAVLKLPENYVYALEYDGKYPQEYKEIKSVMDATLPHATNMLYSIGRLIGEYQRKKRVIEKKLEKQRAKEEKQKAKDKEAQSLNRADIKKAMKEIRRSMKPFIKEQKARIDKTVSLKEKEFKKEWKAILNQLKKDGFRTEKIGDEANMASFLVYGRLVGVDEPEYSNGKTMFRKWLSDYDYSLQMQWYNKKGYELKPTISYIATGKSKELATKMKDVFQKGEDHKLEVLFYRLMKSNPDLKNYALESPYEGGEFTLSAENGEGEAVMIQTNLITAGGYNIQRLHTRWLISVRNTVTGKKEEFSIKHTDKK